MIKPIFKRMLALLLAGVICFVSSDHAIIVHADNEEEINPGDLVEDGSEESGGDDGSYTDPMLTFAGWTEDRQEQVWMSYGMTEWSAYAFANSMQFPETGTQITYNSTSMEFWLGAGDSRYTINYDVQLGLRLYQEWVSDGRALSLSAPAEQYEPLIMCLLFRVHQIVNGRSGNDYSMPKNDVAHLCVPESAQWLHSDYLEPLIERLIYQHYYQDLVDAGAIVPADSEENDTGTTIIQMESVGDQIGVREWLRRHMDPEVSIAMLMTAICQAERDVKNARTSTAGESDFYYSLYNTDSLAIMIDTLLEGREFAKTGVSEATIDQESFLVLQEYSAISAIHTLVDTSGMVFGNSIGQTINRGD